MDTVMVAPHEHELDGKLHADCAMCDLIRSKQAGAKVEDAANRALNAHQKTAERSRVGRDELRKRAKAGSSDHQD